MMQSLILMIQFMTRYPIPVAVDFTAALKDPALQTSVTQTLNALAVLSDDKITGPDLTRSSRCANSGPASLAMVKRRMGCPFVSLTLAPGIVITSAFLMRSIRTEATSAGLQPVSAATAA